MVVRAMIVYCAYENMMPTAEAETIKRSAVCSKKKKKKENDEERNSEFEIDIFIYTKRQFDIEKK